uniref:Chromosome 16 open reading frame 87 n=1 Tax=Cynoglossus semilaevis TaxID=244447 RepID=A0A3P8VGC9_CYNSE
MSANKTKKVKMATKSCPECDQQIPVACKSCPCGFVFISRKLLNAKLNERSPAISDKLELKRRRTERIRRERIDSPLASDMENKRRPRTNSQSDHIRRGRGRPKSVGLKKQEDDKGQTSTLGTSPLLNMNQHLISQTVILSEHLYTVYYPMA